MKKRLILFLSCILNISLIAQISQEKVYTYISSNVNLKNSRVIYKAELKQFYKYTNYKLAWLSSENRNNCDELLQILNSAAISGLDRIDYQYNFIKTIRYAAYPLNNEIDSLQADIRITDAAIHFFYDLAYGNIHPDFEYNAWMNKPDCSDVAFLLADCISNKGSLALIINKLSNQLPELAVLGNKIKWLNKILSEPNFKEIKINRKNLKASKQLIISKLYQLGIVDSVNTNLSDSILNLRIMDVQHQFNMLADGKLRSRFINELNIPVSDRLSKLNISINYYRWLNCFLQNQELIAVNIPSATLRVISKKKTILEFRVIVGKAETPTPTLASYISEIVLYPYWYVPKNIAIAELLPEFIKNPKYLILNKFQVFDLNGKAVDPAIINWKKYSAYNFPFTIRQSSGCDNNLGLLKFNINNPFQIYLHDTPYKYLFKYDHRMISHGCIRLEKPFDLGHFILKENSIATDTLIKNPCLVNQTPIFIPVKELIPVLIWYNPAGIDSTGKLLYYEDPYEKFVKVKSKK